MANQILFPAVAPSGSPVAQPIYIVDQFGNPLPGAGLPVVQSGIWTMQQASNNASVPTGAGNTIIKAAPGPLTTIVVTTAGTGAGNVLLFDNASTNSGLVLFAFPATVSVAQFYQIYGFAKLGIVAQNVLNGPVFTVYYS